MRFLKMMALLLPVLIPALLVGKIMAERAAAPVYYVRIEGYDPRDLLYGHYLVFRFSPETSADRAIFPAGLGEALDRFDSRYYIPERHAPALEDILRNPDYVTEIAIGLPDNGKAFMRGLYIDRTPMRDFLRDLEHRVDLDSHAER